MQFLIKIISFIDLNSGIRKNCATKWYWIEDNNLKGIYLCVLQLGE